MLWIGDASAPVALQDLRIVVGHDHLGPEMGVDDAVVNRHGIIDDALDVKVLNLWPRNVHRCPYHIL